MKLSHEHTQKINIQTVASLRFAPGKVEMLSVVFIIAFPVLSLQIAIISLTFLDHKLIKQDEGYNIILQNLIKTS